ncbi:hypothetical protein [Lacrimispora sp.]|uniref:hypothetical protein n=1 Tax=Lacrimispora sp. TaxID=2719234 RepID=UPI0028ABA2F8|nr:hypothetical protein [Lacrimispora sp.]
MDILLDRQGDISFSNDGDIVLVNSVAQKILIKLRWFIEEWRWDISLGLPYFESFFVKNPDTSFLEEQIRYQIFQVSEVTEVESVTIKLDSKNRSAAISFTAKTDIETIQEEVKIYA